MCGNLRNGSNAGASNLNCRNGLGDANWNYGGYNCLNIFFLYRISQSERL